MADGIEYAVKNVTERLARQAERDLVYVTAHAHREMVAEAIVMDDVLSVLRCATLVENYPDHERGGCCLVCGRGLSGRYVHVVCSTSQEKAISHYGVRAKGAEVAGSLYER